jgi:hypothetical protein
LRTCLEARQKIIFRFQGNAQHAAAGDDGGIDVHRKCRRRHQHRIPGPDQCQGQVGDALLGTDRAHHFGIGIQETP